MIFTNINSIFSTELFEDPDGMLSLSLKQMKKFETWMRPIEFIDRKHYIQGKPDVAT